MSLLNGEKLCISGIGDLQWSVLCKLSIGACAHNAAAYIYIWRKHTQYVYDVHVLLIAYMGAYKTCRVYRSAGEALWLALFMVLGCNLLQFSLYGVWNQGQLCNFMFLSLSWRA